MGDTSRLGQLRAIALSLLIVTSMVGLFAMPVPFSTHRGTAVASSEWSVEQTYTHHTDGVRDAEMVDGTLYTASEDNTVVAVDPDTGDVLQTYSHHTDWVYDLEVVNGTLYTASSDNTAAAIDLDTGDVLQTYSHHTGTIYDLEVVGGTLYTASADSTAAAVDPDTGDVLQTYSHHTDWVYDLEVVDGTLYTTSMDMTAAAVDPDTGDVLHSYTHHTDQVHGVSVADGTLYTASLDNTTAAVDPDTGDVLQTYTHHTDNVYDVEVVDGTLYTGSMDNTAAAIDPDTGDVIQSYTHHTGTIYDLEVVGGTLYTASLDNTAAAVDPGVTDPLTGTVTDREGDPIPNATVEVYDDSTGELVLETTTDGSGVYSAEPAAGDYWIEATKNGVSSSSETFSYDPSVGGTEDVSLDLYYGSGSLEIIDRSDGTLLDDRTVSVEFEDETAVFSSTVTKTTTNGSISYDHLTSSTHEVRLSADGYATRTFVVGDTKDRHYVGLLPSDAERIETTIAIDDRTGHFDPADTWIEVQRYDSTNGWTTEDGAYLGSDNRGTVQWQPGETYRVYARTIDGKSIVVGEHTPTATDSDEILTFPISAYSETEGTTGGSSNPDEWNRNPIADLEITPENPIVDETISLDASSSRDLDGSISSYEWTVDGSSYSGETVSITAPSEAGSLPISLTVTDDQGATNKISTSIYVASTSSERNDRPTPAFTFSPDDPAPGEAIRLDASGSSDDGSIEAFRWDLNGDGSIDAEGETVEFTYQDGGIHKATLIVEDELGATNRISETIPVYDEPPEGSGGFGAIGAGAVTSSGAPAPTDPGVRFGIGAVILGALAVIRRSQRFDVSDRTLGAVGALDLMFMGHAAISDPFAAGAITAVAGLGFVVHRRFRS